MNELSPGDFTSKRPPMNMLNRKTLEQLDEFIGKVEMGFCCVLLVLMVFVVGLSVFLRYVLKSPLIAGMNMATLMLVWMTFFSASAIYKQKAHIAIEFIVDRFPAGLKKGALSLVYIIIAASLVITVIQAIRLVGVQWYQDIVALGIPRSALSSPIVITGILMFLTTIRHLIDEIRRTPERDKG
jgi:TRAP-type C4-dicarboxylate transport system permease small subunit